jgi:hypothetical protein
MILSEGIVCNVSIFDLKWGRFFPFFLSIHPLIVSFGEWERNPRLQFGFFAAKRVPGTKSRLWRD